MPEREHFDRVVAIGDLNGALSVLRDILQGTGVTDARDRWIAGKIHLIQVGDVFNRGPGAREAFALLRSLDEQAMSKGGKVTVLLGNHEVMTALRNEAYCTVEEYLSFATEKQRAAWPARVARAQKRLYHDHPPNGPILPLAPRVEEWMIHHVPGRNALRRAMGARGELGQALRSLPIVTVAAGCVFCHAALTPRWARLGIEGLDRAVREAWQKAPRFFDDLGARDLFRAARGPLWNRQITLHENASTRGQLARSLARLGVERMVVGHTQTDHIPGGQPGRISLRHEGKLVCIDVGLGRRTPSPRTALIIEDGAGIEWMPGETRQLWGTQARRGQRKGWPSPGARRRSRS